MQSLQGRTKHESSSKSNSLHIELSFPMHVAIGVVWCYIRNSWRNQIRRQNIFTSLNCQRHCAPRLNPRSAFSIRFVCPYGRRIDYVRRFKVASFAAIARPRVFLPNLGGPLNWLFLMTVPLSRWHGISSRVSLANSMMAPTVSVIDPKISLCFSIWYR